MNVVTYRSENSINSSENPPSRKSKEVKCPRCKNIGYTIVNEQCDCCAIFAVLVCFPLPISPSRHNPHVLSPC